MRSAVSSAAQLLHRTVRGEGPGYSHAGAEGKYGQPAVFFVCLRKCNTSFTSPCFCCTVCVCVIGRCFFFSYNTSLLCLCLCFFCICYVLCVCFLCYASVFFVCVLCVFFVYVMWKEHPFVLALCDTPTVSEYCGLRAIMECSVL